ncbi:MAG: hypothetical protein RRY95_04310 [Oscillospiraceae bacterium]
MRFLWLPVAAVLAVLAIFTGIARVEQGQSGESQRQLEDSLHRAVVACYATEGIYPPTLSYLQEHYGVQIDERRFTVYYDIFGENLMPDIVVLPNAPEETDVT